MLFYVYAYSMAKADLFGPNPLWPQLIAHRIISYHDDVREATITASDLVNGEWSDPDECFEVGSIPLCHDEHNLA